MIIMNDDKKIKAREFCKRVRELASEVDLPFFVVSDGASATSNNGCEAVKIARENHEKWELEHGANPYEDWSKNSSSTLFIITGPAGVGKSTISKKLASVRKKSALIEGDDIYNQVVGSYVYPWLDGNHLDIFWKICFNNISTYLNNGYDVVFNYIIEPEDLDMLKNMFKDYNFKFVVLLVDEETLLKRDKLRPIDSQMNERCIELLNGFKEYNYDEKYIIDTSKSDIDSIVNIIENNDRFDV